MKNKKNRYKIEYEPRILPFLITEKQKDIFIKAMFCNLSTTTSIFFVNIWGQLLDGDKSATFLANYSNMTTGNSLYHLKILNYAGLVKRNGWSSWGLTEFGKSTHFDYNLYRKEKNENNSGYTSVYAKRSPVNTSNE